MTQRTRIDQGLSRPVVAGWSCIAIDRLMIISDTMLYQRNQIGQEFTLDNMYIAVATHTEVQIDTSVLNSSTIYY